MKSRETEIVQMKRTYKRGVENLDAILHKLQTLNETIHTNNNCALCFFRTGNEDMTNTWIKKVDPVLVPFEYISCIDYGEVYLTEQGHNWLKMEHNIETHSWNRLVVLSSFTSGEIIEMIIWKFCLDK